MEISINLPELKQVLTLKLQSAGSVDTSTSKLEQIMNKRLQQLKTPTDKTGVPFVRTMTEPHVG